MPLHELLRENLAAFELRGYLRRPQQREAARGKFVGDAANQRNLRTNNRQIRAELRSKIGRSSHIAQIKRKTFRIALDSAIARRTPDFLHARRLRELPHQRMLAAATTDN